MYFKIPSLFLIVSLLSCQSPTPQKPPPDIVFIIADDIGYSDFGCYGGEIGTPVIDKLADEGLRFTQFYVENMCNPTRTALLTGRYHLNGYDNAGSITIAEGLKLAGYQNYAVGKWHNLGERFDGKDPRNAPRERGFDHFYGTPMGAGSFYSPAMLSKDGLSAEDDWKNNPDFYYTDAISNQATEYIQNAPEGSPIYMHVAFTAAHWPLHATEEEIALHQGKYDAGWDSLRQARYQRMKELDVITPDTKLSERHTNVPSWEETDHKAWQIRRMEVYAAQISSMDKAIGRIVAALEQTGRLDNTLLMFTVDNGGCHVEYAIDRKGPFLDDSTRDGRPVAPGNLPGLMPGPEDTYQSYGYGWANLSNTPFQWFKQFSHEGGIRVPMIVRWPAGIKEAGAITDGLAHITDVMPTLFEAAGVDYPAEYQGRKISPADGISLLPLLTTGAAPKRAFLCWSHNHGQAVRKDNWKLVRRDKGPWELYDILKDPSETVDLSGERQETVEQLARIFGGWYSSY